MHNWIKIKRDNQFDNEEVCEICGMVSFVISEEVCSEYTDPPGRHCYKVEFGPGTANGTADIKMNCKDFIIKSIIE